MVILTGSFTTRPPGFGRFAAEPRRSSAPRARDCRSTQTVMGASEGKTPPPPCQRAWGVLGECVASRRRRSLAEVRRRTASRGRRRRRRRARRRHWIRSAPPREPITSTQGQRGRDLDLHHAAEILVEPAERRVQEGAERDPHPHPARALPPVPMRAGRAGAAGGGTAGQGGEEQKNRPA